MNHASYLHLPIRDPASLIDKVSIGLNELGRVDALVGVGMSGALAVSVLANALEKRLCIVRKIDDIGTHSCERLEGNMMTGDRWVFIDDLIDTGSTFQHAYRSLLAYSASYQFVGAHLYVDGRTERSDGYWLRNHIDNAKRGV